MKELCTKFSESRPEPSADHEPTCLKCSGSTPASKVVITEEFVDQQNNVITSPSTLANNWIDLLLQLRRDTGQQLMELQAVVREKDKNLNSQVQQIKKLKTRISSLIHEDNMDHLSRQQSMTSYSSTDCDSISSQFSDSSSYKESSCVSSSELLQSVPGHKQFPPAVSHRRIHSKSVSSQSSPVSSRNQPRSVLSRREAADNVENRRRQDQTDFISRIGHKVDTLAVRYSPGKYDCIIGNNHTSTKVHDDPDNLVDPVPRELFAIWFCQGDLTDEEEEKFNKFMDAENRPPVIYSPSFAKPRVNWLKVNKWQLRNLPEPELFAVLSVPADPDYYATTYRKQYVERHGGPGGCMGVPTGCGCIRCNPPFGRGSGLRTNHGIIGMPTEPVHGYVWSGSDGWVLYAGGSYG